VSRRWDHASREAAVLRAIADGHNTVAAIRQLFDVEKPVVVTRLCMRLRHRGLIVMLDAQDRSKAPSVWQLTRSGDIMISAMKNPTPRRSPRRARPVDDAARDGRAQVLSDGKTFEMGRWDGERWVYPLTTTPIAIEPAEVLL